MPIETTSSRTVCGCLHVAVTSHDLRQTNSSRIASVSLHVNVTSPNPGFYSLARGQCLLASMRLMIFVFPQCWLHVVDIIICDICTWYCETRLRRVWLPYRDTCGAYSCLSVTFLFVKEGSWMAISMTFLLSFRISWAFGPANRVLFFLSMHIFWLICRFL